MINQSDSSKLAPKLKRSYFSTIVSLYITMGTLSLVLGFKLVQAGHFLISGAAFILPIRYLLGDIIAEIYGYYVAKQQIWNLLICCLLFALLAKVIIALPSPSYWIHEDAFNFVLGKTLHIYTCAAIGLLLGGFINIYMLSKFRIIVHGRFFAIRSFLSSAVGELTQYIIGLSFIYYGTLPYVKIMHIIFADYILQVFFIALLAPLASITVGVLRKIEPFCFDKEVVNFNPFKINCSENLSK